MQYVRVNAIISLIKLQIVGDEMITATDLRKNVYNILDQVLTTGVPIEVERHGKQLRIIAVDKPLRLKNLKPMKNLIVGDPATLDEIEWTDEWKI
ncbi:MAG: type II toxin-antitoxin system Phd/YefM family antitoxin [Pseudomonadota bacterium]|nr:type II toxin-antitoxin system Phd/YefM family antitoxin [Pseudomonadota bacterium]